MTRHIHADLIIEWAETGCKIEYFSKFDNEWLKIIGSPTWSLTTKYRKVPVKPSVNWDHVHPDFICMATDDNNKTYSYTNKIAYDEGLGCWGAKGVNLNYAGVKSHISFKAGNCAPKDSLVIRPGYEHLFEGK